MNDEKENLVFWERVRGVLSYIKRPYTKALGPYPEAFQVD
jgi:hypothetical protein